MFAFKRSAQLCVAASVLFIAAQLAWQWGQGGIVAHHVFADPARPAISNAWGLLLMPLLGVLTAFRMQQAVMPAKLWANMCWAFLYGGLIAVLYVSQQETMLIGAILLTFGLALWLPLYRAEYLLGYIAGLSFAFGPVLPLVPAAPAMIIALIAMLIKTVWRVTDVKKA